VEFHWFSEKNQVKSWQRSGKICRRSRDNGVPGQRAEMTASVERNHMVEEMEMTVKKIALVTGANKGIGFETCRQLARLDFTVLLGCRDRDRGVAAAEKLRAEGLDVEPVRLDVTDSKDIGRVRDKVESEHGRLDVLINNAALSHPEDSANPNSCATVSMEALRATFAVNFFGLVELTQALLPLIRKSSAGRIVNISSILGSLTLHSDPKAGLDQFRPFAYDASKTAVNMFTVHLAALLKDTPVKVNSAHPGWVRTDIGGPDAPLDPVEGARTGVTLATLDEHGPTGGFFHMGKTMPW
jgi:NAD(P)-dependent dehydrogenase (short-subunit alcohol dehydrogenase family)